MKAALAERNNNIEKSTSNNKAISSTQKSNETSSNDDKPKFLEFLVLSHETEVWGIHMVFAIYK